MDQYELSTLISLKDQFTSEFNSAMTNIASKMSTMEVTNKKSIDSVTSSWQMMSMGISSSLIIYDQVKAKIGQAFAFIDQGAKALRVEESFNRIAGSSGMMADQFLANMEKITKGTMDKSEIMSHTVRMIQEGMSPDAIVKLTSLLSSQAKVVGDSMPEALDRFSRALTYGYMRGVRSYVGYIDQSRALEEYANKLGVGSNRLNEYGRMQANTEILMNKLQERNKNISTSMEDVATKMARATSQTKQFWEELSKLAATTAGPVIGALGDMMKAVNDMMEKAGKEQEEKMSTRKIVKFLPDDVKRQGIKAAEEYMKQLRQMASDEDAMLPSGQQIASKIAPLTQEQLKAYKELKNSQISIEEERIRATWALKIEDTRKTYQGAEDLNKVTKRMEQQRDIEILDMRSKHILEINQNEIKEHDDALSAMSDIDEGYWAGSIERARKFNEDQDKLYWDNLETFTQAGWDTTKFDEEQRKDRLNKWTEYQSNITKMTRQGEDTRTELIRRNSLLGLEGWQKELVEAKLTLQEQMIMWKRAYEDRQINAQQLRENIATGEKELAEKIKIYNDSWSIGAMQGIKSWRLEFGTMAQQMASFTNSTLNNFASGSADALTQWTIGSKSASAAFSDFARSFGTDVSRMINRMLIAYALEKALGWAVSTWGGGGGEALTASTLSTAPYHHGGIVRMHSGGGLSSDEIPAILQKGEFVVRRDAVTRETLPTLKNINAQRYHDGSSSDNGQGGGVTNIIIQAADAQSFISLLARNRDALAPLIQDLKNRNVLKRG